MMPNDPNTQREFNDEQLRELFSALRSEYNAQTPPFAVERNAEPSYSRRRPRWQLAGATVLAALALAAFLWLKHESQSRLVTPGHAPGTPVASITEWKPPTDFLLNTPGRDILRAAPVIRPQPYRLSTVSPPNRKPKTPRATTPLSQ